MKNSLGIHAVNQAYSHLQRQVVSPSHPHLYIFTFTEVGSFSFSSTFIHIAALDIFEAYHPFLFSSSLSPFRHPTPPQPDIVRFLRLYFQIIQNSVEIKDNKTIFLRLTFILLNYWTLTSHKTAGLRRGAAGGFKFPVLLLYLWNLLVLKLLTRFSLDNHFTPRYFTITESTFQSENMHILNFFPLFL